jgi:hypothetical protein
LRIENLTRWSSTFLMLESVKRAYDKGAFDENENIFKHIFTGYIKIYPVESETINNYLRIL